MFETATLWMQQESELNNYFISEKLISIALEPTDSTFELSWTDYYSESGFDKIEKGELKGDEEIKEGASTLSNFKNIHITIFGTYIKFAEKKDIHYSFQPAQIYKNSDSEKVAVDSLKEKFFGEIIKQEDDKSKHILKIKIPLEVDEKFLSLEPHS
ncbi:unnamed protein product [Moneuplotes crassus]|uniref:Uncharacterized protein n=1 Tax=Euplotes crassus TaxID=5936 RepID=A0AAD1Y447_EUPCR|nr:unnamed protein product [Moneuplotes crassus]